MASGLGRDGRLLADEMDILEQIKLSFDEAGIEIPYNKMDVHLKQ
ncbi:MAG: hypothetical protein ACLR8P_20935 [Clostridium fessum]